MNRGLHMKGKDVSYEIFIDVLVNIIRKSLKEMGEDSKHETSGRRI